MPYDLNPTTLDGYVAAAGAAEQRRRTLGPLSPAEEVQISPAVLADALLTIAGLKRQVGFLQSTEQRRRRKP